MREIVKMMIVLTVISIFSGVTLAFFERKTREPIEYQRLRFIKGPAVLAVLSNYDNDPIKDHKKNVVLKESEGLITQKSIFPAKKNGKCFAIAYEVMGEGYHGTVGIMVGIDIKSGNLTGMKVTTHTETPGLGARIVEPAFYEQFAGLGIQDLALSNKGGKINAVSGATISSQGVVEAIKKGLELFARTKTEITKALESI